jgi:hypothetical protein
MLLPLINLVASVAATPLFALYQDLHDIIAQAGYLSICMAWSKSIFKFEFPYLGQRWEVYMNNFDDESYLRSKDAAKIADAQTEVEASRKPNNEKDKYLNLSRVSKVKIAMWPVIKRYKPIGEAKGCGAPGGAKISRICKAHVVYYWGLQSDEGEGQERKPSLEEHIASRGNARI